MSLLITYIFPYLVFLTSPQDRSSDPIPIFFVLNLHDTKLSTLVHGK